MYNLIVKNENNNIVCNLHTKNYKRAYKLAKTIYPCINNITIDQLADSKYCPGCKEMIIKENKCSCWGF